MKLLKQLCTLILAIGMALTMSGISVCADGDLYQLKIDSKSINSGSVTYTVSCGRAMTGLALCCVYDDNRVLVSVGTKKANNDETVTVTAKTQADKGMAKIMLWNSLEDISPLATAVTDNWEKETQDKIKVTIGNTTGYITDLTDNSTTKAFLDMLPLTKRMSDWDGREYWYSDELPYDDDSVQHTYDIGEFTYWCGGWVTAYYDRNDDDVIEAGSVVIGTMDDTLVEAFHKLNGASVEVTFELDGAKGKSYDFDKTYEYETQQINTDNNGANIYGMAYIPKEAGDTVPTVVISHGYGGSNTTNRSYAEYLASHGIAAYCFDFRGGGYGSRSDGETTDMTIFTEKSDLNAVLDMVKELDFVDTDNLFLMGTSQGGLVSAMTAPDRASEISGAILFYPALCIVDNTKEMFPSKSDIPATYNFMGMTVARDYFESVYDYDVYADITRYKDDVLIVHGTADSVVPLSYSEKAAEEYNSAELKIINGGGHGFYGSDADTATEYIMKYIKNHVK